MEGRQQPAWKCNNRSVTIATDPVSDAVRTSYEQRCRPVVNRRTKIGLSGVVPVPRLTAVAHAGSLMHKFYQMRESQWKKHSLPRHLQYSGTVYFSLTVCLLRLLGKKCSRNTLNFVWTKEMSGIYVSREMDQSCIMPSLMATLGWLQHHQLGRWWRAWGLGRIWGTATTKGRRPMHTVRVCVVLEVS